MNGKLLLRRSASMVLASSFLTIAACSVELGGLFDGDAGSDTAQRDAGPDADATADRASDTRSDASIDSAPADDTSRDGPPNDGDGGDATRDVSLDADATREASLDADAASDASLDGDARRDANLDDDRAGDVAGDMAIETVQDVTSEDTAAEPSLDVAMEPTIDVGADAPLDTAGDGPDAPPGTCGGVCNTFDDIGQTVTRSVDQGPVPPMTGGTILDGTYVATSIVQYNGDSTAFSLSETSIISGNIDAWIASTNGQAPVRYTTTFTTSNNQMAFVFCCPVPGNLTITYTTDGATISNVDPANPNRVITYTRQ
jgi:hypothetical protein